MWLGRIQFKIIITLVAVVVVGYPSNYTHADMFVWQART